MEKQTHNLSKTLATIKELSRTQITEAKERYSKEIDSLFAETKKAD